MKEEIVGLFYMKDNSGCESIPFTVVKTIPDGLLYAYIRYPDLPVALSRDDDYIRFSILPSNDGSGICQARVPLLELKKGRMQQLASRLNPGAFRSLTGCCWRSHHSVCGD